MVHPNRLPIVWHALSCSHQWQKCETLAQSEQVVWAAQVLFFFFGGSTCLQVLPQAHPWMLPFAWQVSVFSHQWQVYVFVQFLQPVKSLQDVLFRPIWRKSRVSSVVWFPLYRVRSDGSADVADTRLDGSFKIELKPRIVVVQTTKRGSTLFFNMVCLGMNGIFLLSSLGCLFEIAIPAVFRFQFSPASSEECQSLNVVICLLLWRHSTSNRNFLLVLSIQLFCYV